MTISRFARTIACASIAAGATIASGASITTGIANWKFVDFQTYGGSLTSGTTYTNTVNAATSDSAAVAIAGHPGWVSASSVGPGASWISALGTGASAGIHGLYTYELTLTAPPLTAGTYQISGQFSSDNLVDSFTVNGVEILPGLAYNSVYSFQQTYVVPTTNAPTDITLRVRVYNEAYYANPAQLPYSTSFTSAQFPNGVTPQDSDANPTGFILSGEAVLVPTPQAAMAGMSLLAGLGVVGYVKRRRQNAELV